MNSIDLGNESANLVSQWLDQHAPGWTVNGNSLASLGKFMASDGTIYVHGLSSIEAALKLACALGYGAQEPVASAPKPSAPCSHCGPYDDACEAARLMMVARDDARAELAAESAKLGKLSTELDRARSKATEVWSVLHKALAPSVPDSEGQSSLMLAGIASAQLHGLRGKLKQANERIGELNADVDDLGSRVSQTWKILQDGLYAPGVGLYTLPKLAHKAVQRLQDCSATASNETLAKLRTILIAGTVSNGDVVSRAEYVMQDRAALREKCERLEHELRAVKAGRRVAKLSERCPLPKPGEVAWIQANCHRWNARMGQLKLSVVTPSSTENWYDWVVERPHTNSDFGKAAGVTRTFKAAQRQAERAARRVWLAMSPKPLVVTDVFVNGRLMASEATILDNSGGW